MGKMEEIENSLKECFDILEQYKKQINDNKECIKELFLKEYNTWRLQEINITHNEAGFNELIYLDFDYINRQIEFIHKLLLMHNEHKNKFNRQIIRLISDCIENMKNELFFEENENILFAIQYKSDFSKEYKSILLLEKFSNIDNNVILIGGNGSGKSSLANKLKGNDTENICVIPAQKSLYFSMEDMSMLSTRKDDLVNELLENNIAKSKTKNDYEYFKFQNTQFTKLIVAMKEQYIEYLISCEEEEKIPNSRKTKIIFGQLREVFKILFPEIEFHFNSEATDYFNCTKNNESYHVNSLSEGEKAVIYYTISVLMAKEDSFIVVDEPETYLNPSLTNLLWDYLIQIRKDCQFIFITHSIDFVLGRNEAKIAWIKNFTYPDNWDFDFISDDFALPRMLMTEVLGSQKPIAFCEGNDKSSLDYMIYHALIGKEYTVIPVGGHNEVIKYCDVIASSEWLNIDSIGIVDGDHYSINKINKLEKKHIKVLPFNEIEMFLVSEDVLLYTMKAIYPVNYSEKIEKFKEEFFKIVEKEKDKIALYNVTLDVNEFISREKIQKFNNKDDIKSNLQQISEYNIEEKYNEKELQIKKVIQEKDYEQLLKICNLKKEITRGIADKYLDNNYEMKAVQQIKTNEELKKKIKIIF